MVTVYNIFQTTSADSLQQPTFPSLLLSSPPLQLWLYILIPNTCQCSSKVIRWKKPKCFCYLSPFFLSYAGQSSFQGILIIITRLISSLCIPFHSLLPCSFLILYFHSNSLILPTSSLCQPASLCSFGSCYYFCDVFSLLSPTKSHSISSPRLAVSFLKSSVTAF